MIFSIMVSIIFIMCSMGWTMQVKAWPYVKFETGKSTNIQDVYFAEGTIGYKIRFGPIESQTYGGWLTWSTYQDGYNPFMDIYSINQKFIWNKFFVRYQHYCAHIVESKENYETKVTDEKKYWFTRFKACPYWWTGAMSTISIGFEYDFK